jgi:acetyl-CoA/propionyl-CoA carboxylase biotin carboxyl carrier protein
MARRTDGTALLGPGEAARRLGVTTRTVQRWLRTGRLPAVRVGSRLKVPAEAVSGGSAELLVRRPAVAIQPRPIRRLLVANRGELVARIARTCRRLGITCLALITDDQRETWWSRQADERVPLATTYLDGAAVIRAALEAGADAIHPGYGFLAEQADFAAAVVAAGLTWVGPPAEAMRALGDKAAARQRAAAAGLPVLAGYDGADQTDRRLARAAAAIGWPVLIKPSAGGGGLGMHVVRSRGEFHEACQQARREARAAFGDDRLVLERYVEHPRHVEVQLLCDAHGGAIHLGERDCSLQRRHQKVLEEAPAPRVTKALRDRMGAAAAALARSAGYVGVGTVEFLVDGDGAFTFMELNARLQVEHPVTEAVTGLDLVEAQLRVAAGEPLWLRQRDVRPRGHAVEARLYAEDPWAGFAPSSGRLEVVAWPAPSSDLRLDAGVGPGDVIGTRYDPLLAKVIASGPTRSAALDRLDHALAATATIGVTINRDFLRTVLAWPEVRQGRVVTDTLDARWPASPEALPDEAWGFAAAALAASPEGAPVAPPIGFRLNGPRRLAVAIGEEVRVVAVDPGRDRPGARAVRPDGSIVLDVGGRAVVARLAPPPSVDAAVRHAAPAAGGDLIRAPLAGVIGTVRVALGEAVAAGQVLLTLEAMKMEHPVRATADGLVTRLLVRPGQAVQRGDELVGLT